MSLTNIDNLPLQELLDLLVKNTMALIELTEKRGVDRILIVSKRSDVKKIQLAIENKMVVKAHSLLCGIEGTPSQLN